MIYCGDLNVAHQEIDLKNAKSNRGNAGFTDEERSKLTELLEAGFVDSFRHLYPDKTGAYSWWSYMFHAREKNAGWRIDYFLVSRSIADKINDSVIHPEIMGSDHCPVELYILKKKKKGVSFFRGGLQAAPSCAPARFRRVRFNGGFSKRRAPRCGNHSGALCVLLPEEGEFVPIPAASCGKLTGPGPRPRP